MTALISPANLDQTATVQALLQTGAGCTLKTDIGKTASSLATKGGHIKVIDYLHLHGAKQ